MPEAEFRNKAHRGAYRKGQESYKNGEPRSACPYDYYDIQGRNVTFARSFARAWWKGWDDANKCPKCGGRGTVRAGIIANRRCSKCKGTGKKKNVQ